MRKNIGLENNSEGHLDEQPLLLYQIQSIGFCLSPWEF